MFDMKLEEVLLFSFFQCEEIYIILYKYDKTLYDTEYKCYIFLNYLIPTNYNC